MGLLDWLQRKAAESLDKALHGTYVAEFRRMMSLYGIKGGRQQVDAVMFGSDDPLLRHLMKRSLLELHRQAFKNARKMVRDEYGRQVGPDFPWHKHEAHLIASTFAQWQINPHDDLQEAAIHIEIAEQWDRIYTTSLTAKRIAKGNPTPGTRDPGYYLDRLDAYEQEIDRLIEASDQDDPITDAILEARDRWMPTIRTWLRKEQMPSEDDRVPISPGDDRRDVNIFADASGGDTGRTGHLPSR